MPEQIGNWYSVGCPFYGQTDLRRSTLGKRTAKCVLVHNVEREKREWGGFYRNPTETKRAVWMVVVDRDYGETSNIKRPGTKRRRGSWHAGLAAMHRVVP
ncbi:hypothetical protein M0802_000272 [Mischocyttarus mexicanus]|nr:hypothetical protein M0802_000272 [Mischocyttarus mexicanus]